MIARAVKRAYDENGNYLPQNARLPDMTSTTERFVALQEVYRQKFLKDVEKVKEHAALGPEKADEILRFCAEADHIRVSRLRSLRSELDEPIVDPTWTMEGVGDHTVQCPILWYLGWRVCDAFAQKRNHEYPCPTTVSGEDVRDLTLQLTSLCSSHGIEKDHETCAAILSELVRYQAGEVHVVAAVVGGIAAQEIVKLVAGQYVSLENTYVFNGISSVGASYAL